MFKTYSILVAILPILAHFYLFPAFIEGQGSDAAAPVARRKCRANETFRECSSYCEKQCGEPEGRTCIEMCGSPKCQCAEGYARNNATGRCVLEADCPRRKCAAGEKWNECSTFCEQRCGDPPEGRACILMCGPPKCQCAQGYARNNATGKCVLEANCPKNCDESVCAAVLCSPGTACVPRQVQCVRAPCCPVPECLPVPASGSGSTLDEDDADSD